MHSSTLGWGLGVVVVLAWGIGDGRADDEYPFDRELPAIGWQREFDFGPGASSLFQNRAQAASKPTHRHVDWVDRENRDDAHPIGPNPFVAPDAVSIVPADPYREGPSFDPAYDPAYDPSQPGYVGPGPAHPPFLGGARVPCRPYDSSQILPAGLLYKSYLAGEKEPRFASAWMHDKNLGWRWESTLGGRIGLFRDGTVGAIKPDGWQLDIEGAAMPRLDMGNSEDLDAVDYRFGVPWTWRQGPLAFKAGYYHISSHVGDEFMIRNPTFVRRNYVRDSAIVGVSYDVTPDVRTYGEVAYAFKASDGAEPFEFQFGAEFSPARAIKRGDPFAAVNVHLREEFDFGGAVNLMAGWQWRSPTTDRLARVGLQYYHGKSLQYEFFDQNERLLGLGMWIDY
ncbi:MAG: DUF1207 domain-containing protein [Planctomycetaceae bacterium]